MQSHSAVTTSENNRNNWTRAGRTVHILSG